jgi:WD40 repeat protein/tRNA A-37 threonylcarbamoyl transferase component Bud32
MSTPAEDRLETLVSRWLVLRAQGQEPPSEQLCQDCPELLPELQRLIETLVREEAPPVPVSPPALDETLMREKPAATLTSLAPPGYEILEELGRGGMGVVYKARQVNLNRTVALKMILAGGHAGAEERARFLAEAEAIAAIRHPGIVQIHDFGTHGGLPFFALEFCEGGSLADKLNGTPLPPRQAARLVEQISRAMQAAHEKGIVHRDLKPANILLSFSRDPKGSAGSNLALPSGSQLKAVVPRITDFGLARRAAGSGLTQTGAVMGTPSYMAPEQARGSRDVGPAADVYALGAILYECLTGRPPFCAATALDTLGQVIADEPVPPRQLNARVPRDLETICLKCLRKEPDKRYATAEELAEDLVRWQRGEPVLARPVGMGERAIKWVRRRPAVAGLLAAIVVLTALALGVTTALYRNALRAEKQAKADRDTAQEERDKAREEYQRAEEQLDRAERLLYASQIQAAQREWEAGNPRLAWEQLESCRWDYRGIEHRYLYTLFNRNQTTLKAHTGSVSSVAISSDGKHIVSGSWDRTIKVHDAASGKVLRTLTGHTGEVHIVAISPDGSRIVSGSDDETVKVWNAQTGKVLLTLKAHTGTVWCVAFSPDGKRILSGGQDRTVKIHDAFTGKLLRSLRGHTHVVSDVAISPDGKRIVSGSPDKTVKVYDAATGRNLLTLAGHTSHVQCVAVSPDAKRILSGGQDQMVKVHDAITGKEVLSIAGYPGSVWSVTVSPDGRRIVSSGGSTVKVHDAQTGRELLSLEGHRGNVSSVAVSPDGRYIVSGSEDQTVKVWDISTSGDFLSREGHTDEVNSVAVSGDGAWIVSGSADKTVKVHDARTGKVVHTLSGHKAEVLSVAISPDGRRIVSGGEDQTVKVHDANTGKELLTLTGHISGVSSVAISADGKRIISGSYDRTVMVHDAATGKVLFTLRGHTGPVLAVAISADGTRIASASHDDTVKVWDARTGKALLSLEGHTDAVGAVAVNGDGSRIVSGSDDQTVNLWDGRTGKLILSLTAHAGPVRDVAISADGTRIASGDRTVKLHDARTGKELLSLKGHTGPVSSVALSADGRYIVSGSEDNTVRVWNASVSPHLLTFQGHSRKMIRVAVSTDGKRVFGQDEQGRVLAWNAASGQLLPDPPSLMPAGGREATSADGRLRVSIEGNRIRVHRADLDEARKQREALDRERLARLARFDPAWHRRQLDEAFLASDDFAAFFHLQRLVLEQPWGVSQPRREARTLTLRIPKRNPTKEFPR